jgi:hypothetical protein
MSYLNLLVLTPTHLDQDWEKTRDFQQSVKTISLNLKKNAFSFEILQREELGVFDYLWSFILGDKVHFQIDGMNNRRKRLFSLVLLEVNLSDHRFAVNKETSQVSHVFECEFKTAVRFDKNKIVPSSMQEDKYLAMARMVYLSDD